MRSRQVSIRVKAVPGYLCRISSSDAGSLPPLRAADIVTEEDLAGARAQKKDAAVIRSPRCENEHENAELPRVMLPPPLRGNLREDAEDALLWREEDEVEEAEEPERNDAAQHRWAAASGLEGEEEEEEAEEEKADDAGTGRK